MNITVSKIKSRPLRRLVIALSYPLFAVFAFPILFVFQVLPLFVLGVLVDYIGWQANLARSAAREWRK